MQNNENKKYSIKELRSICQSSAPNPARESLVGRFCRFFSIYFTKLFIHTKITPNQITILSVLVFFSGLGLFILNNYFFNIIGALVVCFSIILDGCDGEVSRFRQLGGRLGANYVEPISHDIQYGFAFIIFSFILYLQGYNPVYLVIGALAGISKLLYRLLEIRYWMMTKQNITKVEVEQIKNTYKEKPAYIRFVYWINKNFLTSTGIFLILLVTAIINRLDLFLIFFSGFYFLFLLLLFAKQIFAIKKEKML